MTDQPAGAQIEMVGVSMAFDVPSGGLLRRRTTTLRVLRDVSFAVARGETMGCVGLPGAGRTTLVQIAAGLLSPTAGYVRTGGLMPVRQAAELAGELGAVVPLAGRPGAVLPGRHGLWPDLTVAAALETVAAIRQLQAGRWQLRLDHLLERLDLTAVQRRPVGALNHGQRLRAEVAAALLHEPSIVLLDSLGSEPDTTGRDRLRRLLRSERHGHDRSILLTGRTFADVAWLADRVLLLDAGTVAFEGTLPQLTERIGAQQVLVVDLTEPGRPLDDLPGTDLLGVEAGGLRQRLGLRPGGRGPEQVLAEVTGRAGVRDVSLLEPQVDDVLARLGR